MFLVWLRSKQLQREVVTNEMVPPRAFVLETRRLLLRSLADEDVDAVHRLYADWDVAKTLSRITHPFSLEAAQQFVGEAQDALVQGSSYVLGMFERRNGALIGVVSLRIPSMHPARREEERADDARLGILGYAVARPSWGQGFASEGAKRMVRAAFDDLQLDRLQASPLRANPASGRVLKGLGFTVAEAGIIDEPVYGGPPRLADRYMLTRGWASSSDQRTERPAWSAAGLW